MKEDKIALTVTTGSNIGLEDYGYPQVDYNSGGTDNLKWISIVHGWFFWDDEDQDSFATYLETWINEKGRIDIILSDPMIFFDFVTPLDDYTMPAYSHLTIGEYYAELAKEKKEQEARKNA